MKKIKLLFFFLTVFSLYHYSLGQNASGFKKKIQTISSQYNILYNAKETERFMLADLKKRHRELLYKTIPLFTEFSKQNLSQEQAALIRIFEKVEKVIKEKPFSNKVSQAYFIKARGKYYEGKHIEAIELLNYIDKIAEEKKVTKKTVDIAVWKAKIMLQSSVDNTIILHYVDSIIKSVEGKSHPKKNQLWAIKAQVAYNLNKKTDAIKDLKYALDKESQNRLKHRWNFLLAQWHEEQGSFQESLQYNQKAEKMGAITDIKLFAKIQNFLKENRDLATEEKVDHLKVLMTKKKYIPYSQIIYKFIADLYTQAKLFEKASENIKKAAFLSIFDEQKAYYYKIAADKEYNLKKYAQSKPLYDSTLAYTHADSDAYKKIKFKIGQLSQIAKLDHLIYQVDTLLLLYNMDENQKIKYVDSIFNEQEKKRLEQEFEKKKIQSQNIKIEQQARKSNNNLFYFYNTKAKLEGEFEFKKLWGDIANLDDWKINPKRIIENVGSTKRSVASTQNTSKFWREILKKVPIDEKEKNILLDTQALAYYEMAKLFDFKLEDYKIAIETFLKLLEKFPGFTKKSEVYYLLHLAYKKLDLLDKAAYYAQLVESEFPASIYAIIIKNPDYLDKEKKEENTKNLSFLKAWKSFNQLQFTQTIDLTSKWINLYPKDEQAPYVFFLRAQAIGMVASLSDYQLHLRQIQSLFPKSPHNNVINHILKYTEKNKKLLAEKKNILYADTLKNPIPYSFSLTEKRVFEENNKTKKEAIKYKKDNGYKAFKKDNTYVLLIAFREKPNFSALRYQLRYFHQKEFKNKRLSINNTLLDKLYIFVVSSFDDLNEMVNYYEKFKTKRKTIIKTEDPYIHFFLPFNSVKNLEKDENVQAEYRKFSKLIAESDKIKQKKKN